MFLQASKCYSVCLEAMVSGTCSQTLVRCWSVATLAAACPLPWEVTADFYKTVINAIHIGNSLPACMEFPGRGGRGD